MSGIKALLIIIYHVYVCVVKIRFEELSMKDRHKKVCVFRLNELYVRACMYVVPACDASDLAY